MNKDNTLFSEVEIITSTAPAPDPPAPLRFIKIHQDKSPVTKWKDLQNQYPTNEGLERAGLVCGEASGNIEGLDIDNHFNDADSLLSEISIRYDLSRFTIIKTQNGGFHVLYRCPVIEGNQKLAQRLNAAGRPDTLIETRGEGGYFATIPTPGYQFMQGNFSTIPTITPDERDELIAVCKSLNEYQPDTKKEKSNYSGHDNTKRPGDRYNTDPAAIAEVEGLLLSNGWANPYGKALRRPGKDKGGISATFGFVGPGVFYVFSTNAHPFEPGYYRPFAIFAILVCGGDYEEAARRIRKRYTPDKPYQKTAPKQLTTDASTTTLNRLNAKELYSDIWLFAVKKDRQTGEIYLELKGIYQDGFRRKLSSKGYYKRFIDDTQAIFIREQSNIIEEVKLVNFKDAVNEMLEAITEPLEIVFNGESYSFNPDQLRHIFYKAHYVYVCDSFLEYLPIHTRKILRDTRNESYFFFANGAAQVTARSVVLIPYHELPDGCIWKDQLIKRNFESKDYEISHFERFIDNICNQDPARKLSAVSVIGYLLHNYHKPDDTQTIVANDEEVTDGKTPQGRTGKKILIEGIKQMRSVAFIDGKMLRPDDKFVFDNVTDSTQCAWLDDVKKDFDFSILHAVSTNGLSPEVKFKTKFHIPFERSPKFYITSNHAINDEGKTNKARMFVIEFSNHYSQKIIKGSESPIKDEHGCYFFSEDWDADEWNRFDSFMLECVLNYLQKGLLDYKREGLAKNKLMQSTSRDFYEWVQLQNFQPGIEYNTSQYFEDFKGTYYGEKSDFPQRGFTNWIKIAAKSHDWIFKTRNSNHIRTFKFQHLST